MFIEYPYTNQCMLLEHCCQMSYQYHKISRQIAKTIFADEKK